MQRPWRAADAERLRCGLDGFHCVSSSAPITGRFRLTEVYVRSRRFSARVVTPSRASLRACSSPARTATRASHPGTRPSTSASIALAGVSSRMSPEAETSRRFASSFVASPRDFLATIVDDSCHRDGNARCVSTRPMARCPFYPLSIACAAFLVGCGGASIGGGMSDAQEAAARAEVGASGERDATIGASPSLDAGVDATIGPPLGLEAAPPVDAEAGTLALEAASDDVGAEASTLPDGELPLDPDGGCSSPTITFTLTVPNGSDWTAVTTRDTDSPPYGEWLTIFASDGTQIHRFFTGYLDLDCRTCSFGAPIPVGVFGIPLLDGGSISETWNGFAMKSEHCGGQDCLQPFCAAPGAYVAEMCACHLPSLLPCRNAVCVMVPFVYPEDTTVVGTLFSSDP
jgi:hypothetical protein